MEQLQLSLLGYFQALVEGTAVTDFPTDKTRALLAYLSVEANRPHRRDSLATLLWPEWDDATARGNLRLSLHRIRQTLDKAADGFSDNLFQTTRETVQINEDALNLDVTRKINTPGLVVRSVQPGSPAEQAGLRDMERSEFGRVMIGDIILQIGGRPVRNSQEYFTALGRYSVGDAVKVSVFRGGETIEVEIKLDAEPQAPR